MHSRGVCAEPQCKCHAPTALAEPTWIIPPSVTSLSNPVALSPAACNTPLVGSYCCSARISAPHAASQLTTQASAITPIAAAPSLQRRDESTTRRAPRFNSIVAACTPRPPRPPVITYDPLLRIAS